MICHGLYIPYTCLTYKKGRRRSQKIEQTTWLIIRSNDISWNRCIKRKQKSGETIRNETKNERNRDEKRQKHAPPLHATQLQIEITSSVLPFFAFLDAP